MADPNSPPSDPNSQPQPSTGVQPNPTTNNIQQSSQQSPTTNVQSSSNIGVGQATTNSPYNTLGQGLNSNISYGATPYGGQLQQGSITGIQQQNTTQQQQLSGGQLPGGQQLPGQGQVPITSQLQLREELVKMGTAFLANDKIKDSVGASHKRAFLLEKGLTEAEVTEALSRVARGVTGNDLSGNESGSVKPTFVYPVGNYSNMEPQKRINLFKKMNILNL